MSQLERRAINISVWDEYGLGTSRSMFDEYSLETRGVLVDAIDADLKFCCLLVLECMLPYAS
jgi:hypothetical protein